MKKQGTFLVPTIGGIDLHFENPANAPKTPQQQERRKAFLEAIQQSMRDAIELNVKIALGFDASSPERQGKNAFELVAMTKRGMSPLAAIRAATVNAAELLGWQDRVGAIEAGKPPPRLCIVHP